MLSDKYILASNSLLIIPAFNEGVSIKLLIKNCKKYFPNILVIDDHSIDDTYTEALAGKPSYILRHAFNCGQGAALSTGFKFFLHQTSFEYLITFDADGQHDPAEAYQMLNYAKNNAYSVVFGTRFHPNNIKRIPIQRIILLKVGILIERIFFGINLSDAHNGLRVISRNACLALREMNSARMAHATEIPASLVKQGFNIILG